MNVVTVVIVIVIVIVRHRQRDRWREKHTPPLQRPEDGKDVRLVVDEWDVGR